MTETKVERIEKKEEKDVYIAFLEKALNRKKELLAILRTDIGLYEITIRAIKEEKGAL